MQGTKSTLVVVGVGSKVNVSPSVVIVVGAVTLGTVIVELPIMMMPELETII